MGGVKRQEGFIPRGSRVQKGESSDGMLMKCPAFALPFLSLLSQDLDEFAATCVFQTQWSDTCEKLCSDT